MRDRQNLVVCVKGGVTGRVFSGEGKRGVYSTDVVRGELRIFDAKSKLIARFAKGKWLYAYAAGQLVQR